MDLSARLQNQRAAFSRPGQPAVYFCARPETGAAPRLGHVVPETSPRRSCPLMPDERRRFLL